MKKQIILFYALLFASVFTIGVFAAPVHAKTGKEAARQIVPLINKNTLFVSHIDLSTVDFPTLCEQSLEKNEEIYKAFNLDEKSVRGLSRETKKLILKGQEKAQKYFDSITKDGKITDVYLLCQIVEKKKTPVFFVAIPSKNRTDEQKKTLQNVLQQVLQQVLDGKYISEIFEQSGFQIFIIYGTAEPLIPLNAIRKELNDQENKSLLPFLATGFSESVKSGIQTVMFLKPEIFDSEELDLDKNSSNDPFQKMQKELVPLLRKIALKFQFISCTSDLNQGKCTLYLHTKSQDDVESIKADFLKISEIFAQGASEGIVEIGKDSDTDLSFLNAFVREFVKGSMKAAMPNSEANRFVWICESELVNAAIVNYGLIGAHFVLSSLEEEDSPEHNAAK